MLEARGASYRVNGRLLIDAVDLRLQAGRLVVLVGPNGAGKSTLLRLLSGEIAATAGRILIDGRDISGVSAHELSRRRAVVPQQMPLSFPFTVRDVVLLGATVPGFAAPVAAIETATAEAIAAVGLQGFEQRLFTRLSGGERQRVHIARALLQLAVASRAHDETGALLLDEPTANLDLAHQSAIMSEARRQALSGRAVLAILHDLNLAAAYADEIVLIGRGRVAAKGTAVDVMRDDVLSDVYGCEVRTNVTPGVPFVLPVAAGGLLG